jgi:hypothetical protein
MQFGNTLLFEAISIKAIHQKRRQNELKGALVFLAVFIVLFAATLAYPDLPPGKQIYGALNVPATDYPVLGIQATTLIEAVFNGVIYGIIAWIIYSVAASMQKPKQQTQPTKPAQ